MGGIVIGSLLFLLGMLFLWLTGSSRGKLAKIQETRTSSARELADRCRPGAGQGQTTVEVKGTVRCDRPLTGEMSRQPCVYYHARESEKTETTRVSYHKGRRRHSTSTSYRTLREATHRVAFEVEDHTGRVQVIPEGAEIEGDQVVDRFQSTGGGGEGFFGSLFGRAEGTRILGVRFTETILPLNRPVYILGALGLVDGKPAVRKPVTADGVFLISRKSEEELVSGLRWQIGLLTTGAVLAFLGGVAAILTGLGTR
ncbi:MAG: hypothetical protein GX442_22340 [Candidatus Riflebacteria bacterium]|nr:hypothetical protein [Candidatus Riflebacteria bacterium]